MRRPPSPILGITRVLTVLAGCTHSPQGTIDTATSAEDQATGGEIIVGGAAPTAAPTSSSQPMSKALRPGRSASLLPPPPELT